MPDRLRCGSGSEETASRAFYFCERVCPFWRHIKEWAPHINPKHLVLLDVGYVVDNVDTSYKGEKRVVFLVIQALARTVIWTTRKKVQYDGANFSQRDLFCSLGIRVKIRCDRKCLDRITFNKRRINAASLVVQKGQRWSHPSHLFLRMAMTVPVETP